jgi:hypothetical protein
MQIPEESAEAFIALYHRLLYFAGQQRAKLPSDMTYEAFLAEDLEIKAECRDALYEPSPLLNELLSQPGSIFTQEERSTVEGFSRYIFEDFIVFRHLKKHTIFLNTGEPSKAYAVLSLLSDLPEIIPDFALPFYVKTVLLPYRGVIVYDGIMSGYNVIIGNNMRREMKEEYNALKKAGKIITTL